MASNSIRDQDDRIARVLIAPDKFRSSATAAQLRLVLADAVAEMGFIPVPLAISDGGEGLLEALGGEPRFTTVSGPLGDPVRAEWRIRQDREGETTAIIEMARASGLGLVGDRDSNDPMRASTIGTGELIKAALDLGATTIIVGCGGSASTDGGAGALEVLDGLFPRDDVTLKIACDVTTEFYDAPAVFAPQKGATSNQILELDARFASLADRYRSRYGREVASVARTGAAGGLAGGLFAVGGLLYSGIDLVADEIMLDDLIKKSTLVITGEGRFDETSLAGKAVGALLDRTRTITELLIIAGEAVIALDHDRNPHAMLIDLVERFGSDRSFNETLDCVEVVTREVLGSI